MCTNIGQPNHLSQSPEQHHAYQYEGGVFPYHLELTILLQTQFVKCSFYDYFTCKSPSLEPFIEEERTNNVLGRNIFQFSIKIFYVSPYTWIGSHCECGEHANDGFNMS